MALTNMSPLNEMGGEFFDNETREVRLLFRAGFITAEMVMAEKDIYRAEPEICIDIVHDLLHDILKQFMMKMNVRTNIAFGRRGGKTQAAAKAAKMAEAEGLRVVNVGKSSASIEADIDWRTIKGKEEKSPDMKPGQRAIEFEGGQE